MSHAKHSRPKKVALPKGALLLKLLSAFCVMNSVGAAAVPGPLNSSRGVKSPERRRLSRESRAEYRPAGRRISSVERAARICRLLRVTEVCRTLPRSQLRPEAGPCRRSASTARRAGVQSHDALFRSRAGLALLESRRSAKAPARQARDAHLSRTVSHTPAALRGRVPTTPSMWSSASFHMSFPCPAAPAPAS